ncbi:flagellar basal body P-ring formation chaperone FlgA [Lignipirellula cremea]|uniref:Flagellar basal body P-ring biosynthesis protein FlgA n=1 Tax=Lignipirellula cremea TaxID=2528010 RepID=A0A518DR43_9BACT|nr:flagellar basal body P-ring formation chaperone FlgA [Lignipirellula cremea]QDU94307.1 flagellar basal body P-ring biosynthesis protein FlgA [Lignipirellula cremea]
MMRLKIAMFLLTISLSHLSAEASEVHLQSHAQPARPLVVLGDIAKIYDVDPANAAKLAAIELFPAPSRPTAFRIRELQDLLSLRGCDMSKCRFEGASVILVQPYQAGQSTAASDQNAFARQRVSARQADSSSLVRQIAWPEVSAADNARKSPVQQASASQHMASQHMATQSPAAQSAAYTAPVARASSNREQPQYDLRAQVWDRVEAAIVQHLQETADPDAAWQVVIDGVLRQQFVLESASQLQAIGGSEPWTGKQQFTLLVDGGQIPQHRLLITANVQRPTALAVAVNTTVTRGEILRADQLILAQVQDNRTGRKVLHNLEDVVGKELLRTLNAGDFIEPQAVRSPLLVKRNQVITVIAINGGVRVRTQVRSLDEGAMGELVSVQTLDRKQNFTAQVSGHDQAEIHLNSTGSATPVARASLTDRK